jgi:hypothetical protein
MFAGAIGVGTIRVAEPLLFLRVIRARHDQRRCPDAVGSAS